MGVPCLRRVKKKMLGIFYIRFRNPPPPPIIRKKYFFLFDIWFLKTLCAENLGVGNPNIGDPSPNNYSVIILAQNYLGTTLTTGHTSF